MIIREFILQGIGRFREPVRFQLTQGLNVFFGGNEKGKTTVADALCFLISLDKNGELQERLRSEGSKEARLGITFQDGPDNFRLLMDLVSDAVLLSKYNQESKKFTPLAKDKDEIRSFFKRDLLCKPLDVYRDIFLVSPDTMLAQQAAAGGPAGEEPEAFTLTGSAAEPAGFAGGMEDFESTSFAESDHLQQDSMTEDELRSEIQKLELELKSASEASDKQDKIEQLEAELTDVQVKIKSINDLKTALQAIEKQVNTLNKFSDLPEDIEAKIDDYLRFEGRIKKEIEDIERQRSQYESVDAGIPPFYRDTVFLAGGGIAALFIVVPVLLFIFVGSWGMYLSAGIFAGLGTMGYALWKDAGKRGDIKSRKEKLHALEQQIKEQRNKYEIEGSVIRSIITSMKLDSPAALKEGIKRYRDVLDGFAKAKASYTAAVAEHAPEALLKREEELKSAVDAAQEQMRAMSVSGMDPYSLSQQIDSLKKRLSEKSAGVVRQKTASIVQEKPHARIRRPDAVSVVPAFIRRITMLAGLTGEAQANVRSLVGSAASTVFAALTNKRFREVIITDNGIVLVTASGQELPLNRVAGSVSEKALLSVVLSTVQLAAEKWPWPVIIDDPLMLLDDTNRSSVYSILQNFSRDTQILFLTKDSNLKPFASAFIALS